MTINVIDTLNLLKSHIESDPNLSYIEAVKAGKYTRKSFPPFQDYAVILSPQKRVKSRISNHVYQYIYYLQVVCIVRNFHQEQSLMGEKPAQVGILAMVDEVTQSLLSFCSSNKTTFEIMGDEVSEDVQYDSHPFPEREGSFHETIIPMKIRTKPF